MIKIEINDNGEVVVFDRNMSESESFKFIPVILETLGIKYFAMAGGDDEELVIRVKGDTELVGYRVFQMLVAMSDTDQYCIAAMCIATLNKIGCSNCLRDDMKELTQIFELKEEE